MGNKIYSSVILLYGLRTGKLIQFPVNFSVMGRLGYSNLGLQLLRASINFHVDKIFKLA